MSRTTGNVSLKCDTEGGGESGLDRCKMESVFFLLFFSFFVQYKVHSAISSPSFSLPCHRSFKYAGHIHVFL